MVTTLRLYVLRAAYLMVFIFLTTQIWPQLVGATRYPLMSGVARCTLAAIGMPLWFANGIDASNYETFKACWAGVILCLLVIPWRYVIDNYLRAGRAARPERAG